MSGRGRYSGGRHSSGRGGRGGRDSGRGGGRGGGGRGGAVALPNPTSALSNLITCSLTPNFQFHLYGVDCVDSNGKLIDSRRRRGELFHYGIKAHLKKFDLAKKDQESLMRSVFFEGSHAFSSRIIPGLEGKHLPLTLVGGELMSGDSADDLGLGAGEVGDTLRIVQLQTYGCPLSLGGKKPAPQAKKPPGETAAEMDRRCADCTTAFVDLHATLSHCKETGHSPMYAEGENSVMRPATNEIFLTYCNVALQRAMGERMARWGREYIDPKSFTEPKDRNGNSMGVKVFRAFTCEFGMNRIGTSGPPKAPAGRGAPGRGAPGRGRAIMGRGAPGRGRAPAPGRTPAGRAPAGRAPAAGRAPGRGPAPGRTRAAPKPLLKLTLTVDLRAKVLRTRSILEALAEGKNPETIKWTPAKQNFARKQWNSEVVICTYDKRCHSVVDLIFSHSPATMPVEGLNISHAQYFEEKKNIKLQYPNASPLVAIQGRNNSTVYLPAELVCGNELEPKVKQQLPMIASFKPPERHAAIEEMKRFLTPGAQKTKGVGGGLLPALGLVISDERMSVPVDVLPLPMIMAAGVQVPQNKGGMWAPLLQQATFKIAANTAVKLNVILVYHEELRDSYLQVYDRLRDLVNRFNALYRFDIKPHSAIKAGDKERHWGEVQKFFGGGKLPPNVFVVDFSKPPRRAASDPAYSVVKQMFGTSGHLSQFVNFNTYHHGTHNVDLKKSSIILQGVARQVLSKCGVRIWWVQVPKQLPLPAVFVGVDVFHAPRTYDPETKKRTAKASVAAIIVQVIRSNEASKCPRVEIYTETKKRLAGQEMDLGIVMKGAVENALRVLKVNPMSCVVWRDGVGDAAISQVANDEIPHLRKALERQVVPGATATGPPNPVSLAYIVCQKRIATKFLSQDGKHGMPAGALVTGLQGADFQTFYINGTSPPYSTPKPVRFVVAKRDAALASTPLPELSWALCHDYPNWTGPIKLPSPVQMAHKLAELAGGFPDCRESIDAKAYANRIYFL